MTVSLLPNNRYTSTTSTCIAPLKYMSHFLDFDFSSVFGLNSEELSIDPIVIFDRPAISTSEIGSTNFAYSGFLHESGLVNKVPPPIYCIIGSGYGDEGKGSSVLTAAEDASFNNKSTIVARFNGGGQAGHTVHWFSIAGITDEESKTEILPNFNSHVCSSFGSNWILNLQQLHQPNDELHMTWLTKHFVLEPLAFISEALEILKHIVISASNSELTGKINSIDETFYSSKFFYTEKALEDCYDYKSFYNFALTASSVKEIVDEFGFIPVIFDPDIEVTTPLDIARNRLLEESRSNRHGSVGLGFGETVERSRSVSFTVKDLAAIFKYYISGSANAWAPQDETEKDLAFIKLKQIYDYHHLLAKRDGYEKEFLEVYPSGFHNLIFDPWIKSLLPYFHGLNLIHPLVSSSTNFVLQFLHRKPQLDYDVAIIFEGAQGLLLDRDSSEFPHVTRSHTGHHNIVDIARQYGLLNLIPIYVTRPYSTKHGAGDYDDQDISQYFSLYDKTNKTNKWQGSLRYSLLDIGKLEYSILTDLSGFLFNGFFGSTSSFLPNYLTFALNPILSYDSNLFGVSSLHNILAEESLYPIKTMANSQYGLIVTNEDQIKDLDLIVKVSSNTKGHLSLTSKSISVYNQCLNFVNTVINSKTFANYKLNLDTDFHFVNSLIEVYSFAFFPFELKGLEKQPFLQQESCLNSISNSKSMFFNNAIDFDRMDIDNNGRYNFDKVLISPFFVSVFYENIYLASSLDARSMAFKAIIKEKTLEQVLGDKTLSEFITIGLENALIGHIIKHFKSLDVVSNFIKNGLLLEPLFFKVFSEQNQSLFELQEGMTFEKDFGYSTLKLIWVKYVERSDLHWLFLSPELLSLFIVSDAPPNFGNQVINEIKKSLYNLFWLTQNLDNHTQVELSVINHKYLVIDNPEAYIWLLDFANLFDENRSNFSIPYDSSLVTNDVWNTFVEEDQKFNYDSRNLLPLQYNHHTFISTVVPFLRTLKDLGKLDLFLAVNHNSSYSLISDSFLKEDLTSKTIIEIYDLYQQNNSMYAESDIFSNYLINAILSNTIKMLQLIDAIFQNARNQNKSMPFKKQWVENYAKGLISEDQVISLFTTSVQSLATFTFPVTFYRTLYNGDQHITIFGFENQNFQLSRHIADNESYFPRDSDLLSLTLSSYKLSSIVTNNEKIVPALIEEFHFSNYPEFMYSQIVNAYRLSSIIPYISNQTALSGDFLTSFKTKETPKQVTTASLNSLDKALKFELKEYFSGSIRDYKCHLPVLDIEELDKFSYFDESFFSQRSNEVYYHNLGISIEKKRKEKVIGRASLYWAMFSPFVETVPFYSSSLKDIIDDLSKEQGALAPQALDYLEITTYCHFYLIRLFELAQKDFSSNFYQSPASFELFALHFYGRAYMIPSSNTSHFNLNRSILDKFWIDATGTTKHSPNKFIKKLVANKTFDKFSSFTREEVKQTISKSIALSVAKKLLSAYVNATLQSIRFANLIDQIPQTDNGVYKRLYFQNNRIYFGESISANALVSSINFKPSSCFFPQLPLIKDLSKYIFEIKDPSSIASIMTNFKPIGPFEFDTSYSPWNLSPVRKPLLASITSEQDDDHIYESKKQSQTSVFLSSKIYSNKTIAIQDIRDFFYYYFDKSTETKSIASSIPHQHFIQILKVLFTLKLESIHNLNSVVMEFLLDKTPVAINPFHNHENLIPIDRKLNLSHEDWNLYSKQFNDCFYNSEVQINTSAIYLVDKSVDYTPSIEQLEFGTLFDVLKDLNSSNLHPFLVSIISAVFKEHGYDFYDFETLNQLTPESYRSIFSKPSNVLLSLKKHLESNSYSVNRIGGLDTFSYNRGTSISSVKSKIVNTPRRKILSFPSTKNSSSSPSPLMPGLEQVVDHGFYRLSDPSFLSYLMPSLKSRSNIYSLNLALSPAIALVQSGTLQGFLMALLGFLAPIANVPIEPKLALSANAEIELLKEAKTNPIWKVTRNPLLFLFLEKLYGTSTYSQIEMFSFPRALSLANNSLSSPGIKDFSQKYPLPGHVPTYVIIPLIYQQ